jgi:hypothetical protein
MSRDILTILDDIDEDDVLAIRSKPSIIVNIEKKSLEFTDLRYSFEEVLSIAKKVGQIQQDTVESVE